MNGQFNMQFIRNIAASLRGASEKKTTSAHPRIAAFLAICLATMIPELALAGPWDSMGASVLAIFTGGLTRTIAIIAVIACGIAAIAGKLSWDWAIKIIVGIVLIFGSTAIVDYLITASV
jgi:type IV secretory pathway VirB2 component (pilin)